MRRVQARWNGWRLVSGVICDRKVSQETKGKVNKTSRTSYHEWLGDSNNDKKVGSKVEGG